MKRLRGLKLPSGSRLRVQDVIVYSLLLLAGTETAAHAYIDPGAGLLVLQGVFAGVAGLLYMLRKSLVRAFSRIVRRGAPPSSGE